MKVLITGGYGFIGSHTAERFYKEGYKVYIIDNLSSGHKENVNIKHKFYQMNVEDRKCEEIFANNEFDVVVHLAAHIDAAASVEDPYSDARYNILGLINMLYLSCKYNVRKFVFASSAAVYGNSSEAAVAEEDECNPVSPYGVSKLTGEYYCKLWKEIYGLDTICLRFSNVYGPRQSTKGEGGVVVTFMNNIFNNKALLVHGSGEQTRDFIYVEDVVDAIYKAAEFCSCDILNISANVSNSIQDLAKLVQKIYSPVKIEYTKARKGDILHSRLVNDKAVKELNWTPMYSLEQGIKKTYMWYRSYTRENIIGILAPKKIKEKKKNNNLFKKLVPYIENLLTFLIVYFLSRYSKGFGLQDIVDFKLVYIIIFGILYGLKQSSIAAFFSCILFIWEIRETGHDIISLVYNVNTLLHFSLYIFVGAVLGYSMDSKKYQVEDREEQIKEIKEKFDFLYDMYNEGKIVRKELQDQITNAEDSFGKIYSITSALDTLEPGKVFDGTVGVIEEVMKSKDVYIFSVSKDQNYLRLISRSKGSSINVDKSIRVSDIPEIENLIRNKSIFVNRDLKKSLPMMMSPIIVGDKVLAIIAVYTLEFETMSLYKQNLLQVVSNLVTSALARAYRYEQAIYDEKYIKGTCVLKSGYFRQLLQSKIESKQKNNTHFILLKIRDADEWEKKGIAYQIEKGIRESDHLGIDENNELLMLLSNTSAEEAQYVIRRLNDMGISVEMVEEGGYYEAPYNSTFSA